MLPAIKGPGISLETKLPGCVTQVRTRQDLLGSFAKLGVPDPASFGIKPGIAVQETAFAEVGDGALGLRRCGGKRLVFFCHYVGLLF